MHLDDVVPEPVAGTVDILLDEADVVISAYLLLLDLSPALERGH